MSPIWIGLVLIGAAPTAESKDPVAQRAAAVTGEVKPIAEACPPVSPSVPSAAIRPEVRGRRSEAGRSDAPVAAQLRQAVQESLRRLSRTSDAQAPAAAAELLELLGRLQADGQLPPAEREELIARVRSRLARLGGQIARRLAAQQAAAGNGGQVPASVAPAQTPAILAQWGNFGRPGMPGVWGRPGAFPPGAPGAMPAAMAGIRPAVPAGGAAAADDHGWELVELIRECIAPAHWDVNGGPGSVQYFRPRRALVVTASGEVHEQVHDLVEQLHRAGR